MTAAIPIDQVYPNRANVRDDLGDLTELTASVKARGIQQPLVVTRRPAGGWTLVDGHRRYEAAVLAGATVVPCVATKAGSSQQQLAVMLAAAMHKSLTPLEQAKAFGRLREQGESATSIASQTGYTVRTVRDRLALLDLPADAQAMLRDKKLTTAAAVDLAKEVRARRSGTVTVKAKRSAWFGKPHPMAVAAAARCDHADTRVMVGAIACGQCWEHVLRADELQRAADDVAAEFGDTPEVQAMRRRALMEAP